jgi:drug/metabolite transporter (DMT)-like permease
VTGDWDTWDKFVALDNTNVTNVVLIGRLEPPIGLALSIWLLQSRVSPWTVAGSLVCFVGVAATALFASSEQKIAMMGDLFHLGKIILIGIVLSAIGNLRQMKTTARQPLRLTPGKHMEMTIGFRGF